MPDFLLALAGFSENSALLWGGILALLTGALILVWPNIIYYLVAGNLLIVGVLGYASGLPHEVVATAMISGLLIIIFPKLIPYLFACYLLVLALLAFLGTGLTPITWLALLIAILLFALPNLIAYLIAAYFILQGLVILFSPLSP
jgi:hypothetical protein